MEPHREAAHGTVVLVARNRIDLILITIELAFANGDLKRIVTVAVESDHAGGRLEIGDSGRRQGDGKDRAADQQITNPLPELPIRGGLQITHHGDYQILARKQIDRSFVAIGASVPASPLVPVARFCPALQFFTEGTVTDCLDERDEIGGRRIHRPGTGEEAEILVRSCLDSRSAPSGAKFVWQRAIRHEPRPCLARRGTHVRGLEDPFRQRVVERSAFDDLYDSRQAGITGAAIEFLRTRLEQ